MANASSNQQRSLKPSSQQPSPYSTSGPQLSLPTVGPQSLANAYQPPPYGFPPHDPSAYGFQQPPHAYGPSPLSTHPLPHQQSHVPPHPSQTTPNQGNPSLGRKRRNSDAGDPHGGPVVSAGPNSFMPPPMDPGGSGGPGGSSGGQDPNAGGMHPPQHPQSAGSQGTPGSVPMSSPVVKKGRTNTPWTPAEEQRLKTLRDAGSSWSDIAKMFPTRTEGSVKKHWYKDMHYAEFAADESAALLQAIKEYENNKWKVIGQKLGKPAKACEQFAKEQGWKV